MKKMIDLSKTQFLVDDHGQYKQILQYRRKRALMLFDKDGIPLRLISHAQWIKLKETYPEEVKADQLFTAVVWTLAPILP